MCCLLCCVSSGGKERKVCCSALRLLCLERSSAASAQRQQLVRPRDAACAKFVGSECARAHLVHVQCAPPMHSCTCSTAAAWQQCSADVLMLCCGLQLCTALLICIPVWQHSRLGCCCAVHPLYGFTIDWHQTAVVSTSAAACRSHTGFIACITAFKANKFVGVLYVIGGAAWTVESLLSIWVFKLVRLLAINIALHTCVSGSEASLCLALWRIIEDAWTVNSLLGNQDPRPMSSCSSATCWNLVCRQEVHSCR